jgi:hypothetical protein
MENLSGHLAALLFLIKELPEFFFFIIAIHDDQS